MKCADCTSRDCAEKESFATTFMSCTHHRVQTVQKWIDKDFVLVALGLMGGFVFAAPKGGSLVATPIAARMLVNPSDFTRENGVRLCSTEVGDHSGTAGGVAFWALESNKQTTSGSTRIQICDPGCAPSHMSANPSNLQGCKVSRAQFDPQHNLCSPPNTGTLAVHNRAPRIREEQARDY